MATQSSFVMIFQTKHSFMINFYQTTNIWFQNNLFLTLSEISQCQATINSHFLLNFAVILLMQSGIQGKRET